MEHELEYATLHIAYWLPFGLTSVYVVDIRYSELMLHYHPQAVSPEQMSNRLLCAGKVDGVRAHVIYFT